MTARNIATGCSLAALLAACSTPHQSPPAAGFATQPPIEASPPLVSALESGGASELALVRPMAPAAAQPVAVRKSAASRPARTAVLADPMPAMSTTAVRMTSVSLAPAPAPALPPAASGTAETASEAGSPEPAIPVRNPVIIIRGGPGGIHDDCAIHGRRGLGGVVARPGVAINSRVPPRGTSLAGGDYGRSGGSGFPRGGIR